MNIKEILISIFLFVITILLIVMIIMVTLNQLSPFKECYNKPDDYKVQLGERTYLCGELKAVNTSLGLYG